MKSQGRALLLAFFCLVAAWKLAALLLGKPYLPPPELVFSRFWILFSGGKLSAHTAVSAWRVFLAVLLSFLPASAVGIAAGRSARLDAFLSPLAYLLYPLPKAAFLPIVILFFGLGNAAKVFVIALILFFQMYVSVRDASKNVPRALVDSVQSLGATSFDLVRYAIVPACLPALIASLRVSIGTATAVLFLAETFATENGLGWYIMDAWARVDYPGMYSAILALSLFGFLCFAALDAAERTLCPWKD